MVSTCLRSVESQRRQKCFQEQIKTVPFQISLPDAQQRVIARAHNSFRINTDEFCLEMIDQFQLEWAAWWLIELISASRPLDGMRIRPWVGPRPRKDVLARWLKMDGRHLTLTKVTESNSKQSSLHVFQGCGKDRMTADISTLHADRIDESPSHKSQRKLQSKTEHSAGSDLIGSL